MGTSLYTIQDFFRQVASRIDEELDDNTLAQLEAIEAALPERFDAYCALRREFEAGAAAALEESKRLKALAQTRQNTADRLWQALSDTLSAMGQERFETPRFKAWFQKNGPSVRVDCDPATLPNNYVRLTIAPDRTAILADYKDGKQLPAGVTVEQSVSLRMR